MRLGRRRQRAYRGGAVYRRGQRYVLISEVGTPDFTRVRPPCEVLAASVSDADLGAALRRVVEAWEELPMPPSDEEFMSWKDEILRTVGVRDWATLERNAKLVELTFDDEGWQFVPMRRTHGGWVRGIEDDDLDITRPRLVEAAADDETVGAALREALSGPTPSG